MATTVKYAARVLIQDNKHLYSEDFLKEIPESIASQVIEKNAANLRIQINDFLIKEQQVVRQLLRKFLKEQRFKEDQIVTTIDIALQYKDNIGVELPENILRELKKAQFFSNLKKKVKAYDLGTYDVDSLPKK